MSRQNRSLKRAALVGLAMAALGAGAPSWAVTECQGHVTRIFTGDSGNVWVLMDTTVAWYVTAADPNLKNILSSATVALAANLQIAVRFYADGITCNAGSARGDVGGVWLIGS